MSNVSLFPNHKQKATGTISTDAFIDGIIDGKWQDVVLPIRIEKDPEKKRLLKVNLPCITPSGYFASGSRTEKDLTTHSGFIGLDFDDVEDVENVKARLASDNYVYCAFVSCGGHGLCIFIKINPNNHANIS